MQVMAEDAKTNAPATAPKINVQTTPAAPKEPETMDPKELREKVSYAIGMHFGNQLKRADFDFDLNEMQKAMKDVLAGGPTKMKESDVQPTINKWQTQIAQTRKKQGDDFLAENAKKPNIKTTASGLQYEVIQEGKGASPAASDTVKVNYRGTLINGTEFDSSYKRNQPAEFNVSGVIKGWTEGLQLMKEGAKYKFYIPSQLGYGERGTPNIPPSSALIFEVELLEVKKPEPPKPAASQNDSVQAVSGEIIKVPSAEELKKGAKIEVLKEEDVKRMLATNAPGTNATSKGATNSAAKPQSR